MVESVAHCTSSSFSAFATGGCKVLIITVDAPSLGKKEKDLRHKFVEADPVAMKDTSTTRAADRSQGVSNTLISYIDPALNWRDLPWLRSITKMKICLKGIQTAEVCVCVLPMLTV